MISHLLLARISIKDDTFKGSLRIRMCLLNVIVGSSIEKGQDKGKEEAGVSGSVESRFA